MIDIHLTPAALKELNDGCTVYGDNGRVRIHPPPKPTQEEKCSCKPERIIEISRDQIKTIDMGSGYRIIYLYQCPTCKTVSIRSFLAWNRDAILIAEEDYPAYLKEHGR